MGTGMEQGAAQAPLPNIPGCPGCTPAPPGWQHPAGTPLRWDAVHPRTSRAREVPREGKEGGPGTHPPPPGDAQMGPWGSRDEGPGLSVSGDRRHRQEA